MRTNIFDNLITDEDSLTEGFVNMLLQFEFDQIKDSFCELCCKLGVPPFQIDSIETQQQYEGERPDIILLTKNKEIIVIEVKKSINTGMQETQKGGYKEFIAKYKEKYPSVKKAYVLFLIPRNYLHQNHVPSDCKVLTWEDLFHSWEEKLKSQENKVEDYVINSFIEIVRNQIYDIPEVRMDIAEVNKMITYSPDFFSIGKIMNIIKAVEYFGSNEKSIKTYERYNEKQSTVYIKDSAHWFIIGFGVWGEVWKRTGLPLSIYVYLRDGGGNWDTERCKKISDYLEHVENCEALNLKRIEEPPEDSNYNIRQCWVLTEDFYCSDKELGSSASKIIETLWHNSK